MNRKQTRVDEEGNPIDIEGINATPEALGRALMTPRTRKMVDRSVRRSSKNVRRQRGL